MMKKVIFDVNKNEKVSERANNRKRAKLIRR